MSYQVEIQSDRFGQEPYTVTLNNKGKAYRCSCPARKDCKHFERAELKGSFRKAAGYLIARELYEDSADFLARFEELVDAFKNGSMEALQDGGNAHPVNQAIRQVIAEARFHYVEVQKAKVHPGSIAHSNIVAPHSDNCPRCGGKGIIKSFLHVQNGVCFRCEGSGRDPKASQPRA